MKNIIVVTLLFVFPQLIYAGEFEWAQRARERGPSPAIKEAIAKSEARKKCREQEEQKRRELADYVDDEGLAKIEIKILEKDFDGAINLTKSLYPYNLGILSEVERIGTYFNRYNEFYPLATGHGADAVTSYKQLIIAYNSLPETLHFSEKVEGLINDTIKVSDKFIKRECGKDYMNIKVGMKLNRVQKCVGEFTLYGQVKTKHGVVDHYNRGGTHLYVKNGKVVAWGE